MTDSKLGAAARETLLAETDVFGTLGAVTREVLVSGITPVSFAGLVREDLLSGVTPVLLGELAREVLMAANTPIYLAAVAREVLVGDTLPVAAARGQVFVSIQVG